MGDTKGVLAPGDLSAHAVDEAQDAASVWNGIATNPLNIVISSHPGDAMDFDESYIVAIDGQSNINTAWTAQTEVYRIPGGDKLVAHVLIFSGDENTRNPFNYYRDISNPNFVLTDIVAHEVGHAIGIGGHHISDSALMDDILDLNESITLSAASRDAVNYLYNPNPTQLPEGVPDP